MIQNKETTTTRKVSSSPIAKNFLKSFSTDFSRLGISSIWKCAISPAGKISGFRFLIRFPNWLCIVCMGKTPYAYFPTRPSSLLVVAAKPDKRLANRTQKKARRVLYRRKVFSLIQMNNQCSLSNYSSPLEKAKEKIRVRYKFASTFVNRLAIKIKD